MRRLIFLPLLLVTLLATGAIAETTELAEDPPSNVIRWTTASESDTFGYDVYRGLAEEGPFERVTESPIPGAGTSDTPNSYEFIDAAIEVETTYWYYVEAISMTGERERFTPIYPAAPKPGPEHNSADG